MITGLGHVAVRTSDIEKSVKFYTETLGLKEAFRLYGPEGELSIVYIYIAPDQFIELFVNGRKEHKTTDDEIGFCHISLQIDSVEKYYEEILSKGIEPDTGILLGRAKCRMFWVHDPDGNPIELMELPPESMQAQATARFASENGKEK